MNATGISAESPLTTDETEKTKRPDRFTKIHDGLVEQFAGLGILVYSFHEQDGTVIIEHADSLATRLTAVARQNPAVYKVLKRYLEESVWFGLVAEIAAIANQIAANHGLPIAEKARGLIGKRFNNNHVSGVPATS